MASTYKILWTQNALNELQNTFEYLDVYFSEKEKQRLARELERTLNHISKNPEVFPLSDDKKTRKAVVQKFNSMFYLVGQNQVEIISFYSNRQKPKELDGSNS